jgi:hypothetical protein
MRNARPRSQISGCAISVDVGLRVVLESIEKIDIHRTSPKGIRLDLNRSWVVRGKFITSLFHFAEELDCTDNVSMFPISELIQRLRPHPLDGVTYRHDDSEVGAAISRSRLICHPLSRAERGKISRELAWIGPAHPRKIRRVPVKIVPQHLRHEKEGQL